MHLLARFAGAANDAALAKQAAAAGLAPTALSSLAMACDCEPGLLLSFTNVPATAAPALAARLSQAIGCASAMAGTDAYAQANG